MSSSASTSAFQACPLHFAKLVPLELPELTKALVQSLCDPSDSAMVDDIPTRSDCNSKVWYLATPDKRVAFIINRFKDLPEQFLSTLPVVTDPLSGALAKCIKGIEDHFNFQPFIIAAALARNEDAFNHYFPALSQLRGEAVRTGDLIARSMRETILCWPSATSSNSEQETLMDVFENIYIMQAADAYGPKERRSKEIQLFANTVESVEVLSMEAISIIRCAYDKLVKQYPSVRSVAEGHLAGIFMHYDPEFQTQIYAWMGPHESNKAETNWRTLLSLFLVEMAHKINAGKRRLHPRPAAPPVVARISTNAESKQEPSEQELSTQAEKPNTSPPKERTGVKAYRILAKAIRALEEQGICSHCLIGNHTWRECPKVKDIRAGVSNLIYKEYSEVTGNHRLKFWGSLFKDEAKSNEDTTPRQ